MYLKENGHEESHITDLGARNFKAKYETGIQVAFLPYSMLAHSALLPAG